MQRVLESAEKLAVERELDVIQSHHILMALLQRRRCAARILYSLMKAPVEKVVSICSELKQLGYVDPKQPKPTTAKPSARAEEVLDAATAIALELGYNKVTTAHLLLACLSVDSFAKTVLRRHNVKLEAAQELLTNPRVLEAE